MLKQKVMHSLIGSITNKKRLTWFSLVLLSAAFVTGLLFTNVVSANPYPGDDGRRLKPAYREYFLDSPQNETYGTNTLSFILRVWTITLYEPGKEVTCPFDAYLYFYILDGNGSMTVDQSRVDIVPIKFTATPIVNDPEFYPYTNLMVKFNVTLTGLEDGSHNLIWGTAPKAGTKWNNPYVSTLTPNLYFTVDTTPPTISILSPKANQCFGQPEVDLEFSVNEPNASYIYQIDNTLMFTAGNGTVSDLSEGNHSLKVFATDQVGNKGTSETVPFTVAFTEPDVTSTEPPQTQNSNIPTVHATLTATPQTTTPFTPTSTQPVKPNDPSSPFTALILGCTVVVTIAVCMTLLYLRKKQKHKA
jgi:hypothetical protein